MNRHDHNIILGVMINKLRTGKLIRVTKDSTKVGMELYLPGLTGPVVVRNITETDAGVRLHTDVGSFEFGPSDSYSLARPAFGEEITKEEKLNAKN